MTLPNPVRGMRSLVGLLLLWGVPAGAVQPALSVGFGSADITPTLGERPVFLAGFGRNRPAANVHDPLLARAVVLSDGRGKIALATADVIGLFLPVVERVRAKLPGFRYVLVAATHNHQGPDTLGLWGRSPFQSGVDPEYIDRVVNGIAEAIRSADAALSAAEARIGTAAGPDLLADTRLPVVKMEELAAIRFEDPATGKPVGILVQWHIHPEVLGSGNSEVSADFVAATVKHLEQMHGCPVAYFSGAVGGMMTPLGLPIRDGAGRLLPEGSLAKTERYGQLVGELTDRALAAAVPARLTPIGVETVHVLVPVENSLYKLGWQAGVLKRPIFAWAGDPFDPTPTETADIAKPAAIRTEVGYLRLGEMDVAAIPGEIYPELVLGRVQDPPDPAADFPDAPVEPAIFGKLPGRHRLILGLANDEIGYLIPKRQWDERPPFCYGRTRPQYGETNSVGPDAAGIVCEAFRRLLP